MNLLARRPYSRSGLRERLLEKYSDIEADAAVARLVEQGLLEDRAYAESFVRERFERRGQGRLRIIDGLRTAGVDAALAEAVVADMIDDRAERERAAAVLAVYRRRRGVGGIGGVAGRKTTADRAHGEEAAFRHLTGRGFAAELVRDLLGVSL